MKCTKLIFDNILWKFCFEKYKMSWNGFETSAVLICTRATASEPEPKFISPANHQFFSALSKTLKAQDQ